MDQRTSEDLMHLNAALHANVSCKIMLALSVCLAITVTAVAQDAKDTDQIVTTHHQIMLRGQPLKYTARAGLIPIRDNEAGDIHAHMFFIAYTLDGVTNQRSR